MVLGQFRVVFGAILGWEIINNPMFLNGFVNITFLKKIELENASWAKLGAIWVPKRTQKGCQIGAEMASKIDQKIRSVFDRVLARFGRPGGSKMRFPSGKPTRV